MSPTSKKKVTLEFHVEIDDDLALADAGFVALRQAGGSLVDTAETFQSSTDAALLALLGGARELPGARVVRQMNSVENLPD